MKKERIIDDERSEAELEGRIRAVLTSTKLDHHFIFAVHSLLDDPELTYGVQLPCLVRLGSVNTPQKPGELGPRIGNIAICRITLAQLVEFVADPDVDFIELSRPVGTSDAAPPQNITYHSA